MDKLFVSTAEIINKVKQALLYDDVYPANPDFIFSTDDSTSFAFGGVSNGNGGKKYVMMAKWVKVFECN